jgi:spore coat protein U-like protein
LSKLKDIATAAALAVAIVPAVAHADTIGTIDVSLNVTSACVINGAAALQPNAGTVGAIRFPDQPGIFGAVDAELVGTGGSGALSVLCSPGVSPKLTIGSGTHDAGGRRQLAYNGTSIPYRLFSDPSRTTEIGIGQQIALPLATGAAAVVPIYSRINGAGYVLPAGAYADTVQVTLTW